MAWRVALLAGLGLLTLAGCRTTPVVPPVIGPGADAPWALQRESLAKVTHYTLGGRVAVAANGQGFQGALRYQQQQQHAELAIDGPLGIGGVRVSLDGEQVNISNSRGESFDGPAARSELEQRLGFTLPLAELRWWLLGLPAPGEAALEQDPVTGEIRAFQQTGWRVSIDARTPAMGFALPQRLVVSRDGARMKLLIENWQP